MYDTTKPYKKNILELVKQTWNTKYVYVEDWNVKKKFSHAIEYHHSDGIGTKGFYHWQRRTFGNGVKDALAMNLNDLAFKRATPYAAIDHIIIPEDDNEAILEIIKRLSEECIKRDIAITGGETAIHNNTDSLEICTTVLGFIENPKENKFELGDLLVGIGSDGLHSNGFTKVREVFGDEFSLDFVRPTLIYSDNVLELNKNFELHGMMHITGGAYTKLKDLLGNMDAKIRKNHLLTPDSSMMEMYSRGLSDNEMYKTFNCGVGFVISCKKQDADKIMAFIKKDFRTDIIGEIVKGSGKVVIDSIFSNKTIEL